MSTQTNTKKTVSFGKFATVIITILVSMQMVSTPTPKQEAMAGEITKTAIAEIAQIQDDFDSSKDVVVEAAEVKPPIADDKTELPPVVQQAKVPTTSSIPARQFRLNSGKFITGQNILDMVKGNPNGLKLWQAFNDRFGQEVADTAGISLYYENGTMKADSIGVCNAKHMIGGDYRNCNYADMNSAGMDVGLKQINTFYQAKRITKLGGEGCSFGDSKDRQDPCNQKKIAWLLNVDNNIKIAIDIYQEQGNFNAWYGFKRAFNQ